MHNEHHTFHVGVNIFVVRNNQLLLGKRKGAYGAGTWGLPGGHLEKGELMRAAAARELEEETGLKASALIFANLVNDWERDAHYVQVGFVANEFQGEPTVKEPDKCEEWRWFPLERLPENIFPGHQAQIRLFQDKKQFDE